MAATSSAKMYFPQLFALLKKLGIDDAGRAQLVDQYTDGRSSSARDLRRPEILALIQSLQSQSSDGAPLSSRRGAGGEVADKMRKRIISMAHEMGWELPLAPLAFGEGPGVRQCSGKPKADMPRINAWCEKYGYLHKPLNSYTLQELPTLVTQFENMYQDFIKKITL